MQHPGVAEAVEADLRNLGLVRPILERLAPELDASAVLAEIRDRISDEVDYELEAQHQRRLQRLLRGHPHVRVPHVHTDLSTRRVLVTEYVEGLQSDEIERLGEPERDRIAEIAFRCYFDLAFRAGVVAGDPHPDNCVLCPDGRLCLLDFGLLRDLDTDSLQGELAVMRAIADGDAQRVHDSLAGLGYLPNPRSVDPDELLEHLAAGGEWMLAEGFRRIDPAYVTADLRTRLPTTLTAFPVDAPHGDPPGHTAASPHGDPAPRAARRASMPEPTGERSPPNTTRASRRRPPSGAPRTPSGNGIRDAPRAG